MNAADIAEQAITKMELEESGQHVEEKPAKDAPKDEPKAGGDADRSGKDGSGDTKDDKKAADKSQDEPDDAKKAADEPAEDKEEGKYTADDAVEVEDQEEPEAPATDSAGVQLSAAEQKYIVDNIGEPLVFKGFVGEGENRKEVEIKAYTPNDIPQNFQFRSDAERAAAATGFLKLEQRAEQLLGNFRTNQSQTAARDFEKRENEGIRLDVSELQKEGAFPKFKIQPGQPGFDEDPAAQQMADVLEFMTERNSMYLQQYNQGRPYRHIGFREAFELWQAKQAPKQREEAQKQEDAARKEVADKVGRDRSISQPKIQKPRVRTGTTVNDILAHYETEEW